MSPTTNSVPQSPGIPTDDGELLTTEREAAKRARAEQRRMLAEGRGVSPEVMVANDRALMTQMYENEVLGTARQELIKLEARERAAKRLAEKKTTGLDTWTARKKLGEKTPPDIFGVRQADRVTYKYLGRSSKRHLLFGATGSAKTFTAAGFAHGWMVSNRPVAWFDFEDQGDDLPSMLQSWGPCDHDLLHYFQPEAPPDITAVISYCQAEAISLVVIDAAVGAYDNATPDKDYGYSGTDVETFDREVLRPLSKAGITTVLIDHSGNDAKGRPIGAARKLQCTDIAFEVTSVQEISMESDGYSSLTVRKFRGGAYAKKTVPAYLVVERGRASLKPQAGEEDKLLAFMAQGRPSAAQLLLARTSAVVGYVGQHQDEMPSQAKVKEDLMREAPELFTSEFVTRGAIKHATDTDRIVEKNGPRNQKVYELPAAAAGVTPSQLQPDGESVE